MKHTERRRLRVSFIIITAAIVAVLILLAINGYKEQYVDEKKSVILISKRLTAKNDFWPSVFEGAKIAADDYAIDLAIIGPESEADYELQNTMIEEAIAKKPDAIALIPSSYTMTISYAKKIEEAGIKLILLDSVMEEEIGQCIVTTDNFEGGQKMGEYMKQYADETSVIGIVSHIKGASTAIDRELGVRAGLGEYEKQIAAVVYSDSNYEQAYEVTKKMLETYPEMNIIIGLNEDSAVGAARAVKELKRSGQIRMIGFDSSMEQVQLLEEGVFDAIVVQKPLNMGYLGIKMAYEAILNKSVPAKVDSGSVLITADTIYTKENEKLLFPFKEEN